MTRKEYNQLAEEVRQLDRAYFREDRSPVSDAAYDRMLRQLEDVEAEHPDWVAADSPTRRMVDGLCPEKFTSREHVRPMLSLAKVFDLEALDAWRQKFPEAAGDLVLEPKVDGLAVDLRYEHGRLVTALTRGDGRFGDEVTWQASGVFGIPLQLEAPQPEILHVRGEVFMLQSVFRQVNAARQALGRDLLANPRNAAAGALKSLDSAALTERRLRFLPYGVGYVSPDVILPAQEHVLLDWLGGLGFAVMPKVRRVSLRLPSEELAEIVAKFNFDRRNLDFATDGLVVKLNNLRFRETLPPATKVHAGAIAYKYAAEEAETTCVGVTFQVGRTGAIAPVAELAPVDLDGTTVRRASLHNRANIDRLGLRVGDLVSVRKAGEIIPEVVSVVEKRSDGHAVVFPASCPACGSPVKLRKNADDSDSAALFCTNTDSCSGQFLGSLEHWCARDAMDIQSVGPETLALLMDHQLVARLPDLYRVTLEQLLTLPGFGLVKADKVFAELQESKGRGLARVLAGFGIAKFGRTLADRVARDYPDLWSFAKAVQIAAEGGAPVAVTGPVVTKNVAAWLTVNWPMLQELEQLGVSFKSDDYVPVDRRQSALRGWSVVFTGTLQVERDTAAKWVVDLGGKVVSSVSGKTTHLVVGLEPGSKLAKAKKLGITILDEEAFKQAVGKA